ncbi:TetR/AcrR family transcriptional regulator [Maritalea mediterranea]|uniref:TetR/AcrR family transcriptional regulator n=1 Tax=Maritalea mediterranea TaxID=2909667 RepID=A0ABS9E4C6_9HYPH|nr:TetR/AcrR family transcriptional regulator [Maritalea mediterranea]MCF4097042.1 TetR/AcrR family transcriptional regulator [Maritalea mediterranea]
MSDLKEQLLSIAFDMFLAQGYDGVGLSEVIKKAGVSKGALYHHFSSKDDLIDQVLQRYFLDGFAAVEFDALTAADAKDQLSMLVAVYQAQFGAESALNKYGLARYFALFFDSLARNENFAQAICTYYQKIEAALSPEIRPYLRQMEGEIYLAAIHRRAPNFSFLPQ